jgi:dienelactone hydrolase
LRRAQRDRIKDWTPSSTCETLLTPIKAPYEISLKIYENAFHCFDWEGLDTIYLGHKLKYNVQATKDAALQVKNFLSKYLK